MNCSRQSWLAILGRIAAVIFLFLVFPMLLLIGLFIRATAGSPVVLVDTMAASSGELARGHRFRTTGEGLPIFHTVGRLLRRYGLDAYPAFWSVARGDIMLSEVLRSLRRG